MTLHLNKVECASPYCLLPILAEIRSGVLEKKPMLLIFNYIFPLKSGMVHHLNKNEFPSPKDGLCWVCLILVKQFWTRRFSRIDNGLLLWYFLYTWRRVWFFICINSNSLMIQWSQTYKGHKNILLFYYILHTIFCKFYIFSIQSTPFSVNFALFPVNFTLFPVKFTLFSKKLHFLL